ncbi:MAG: FHA domain-containing protein [Chloroflexaceae bacterium]|nr:FHA domain-containing protein [Chloroflexaceae bacterium]
MKNCPSCGAENLDLARFCDQCGTPLPPAAVIESVNAPTVEAPAAVLTMTCPECGASVLPGEAFCDTCGASLLNVIQPGAGTDLADQAGVSPTEPATSPPPVAVPQPVTAPAASPAPPAPPAWTDSHPPGRTSLAPARLIVVETSTAVPLPETAQALVGRSDPVSSFYPDVDLAPHNALHKGVGRRHMRLIIQNNHILMEDLDSTNGSFVNGSRLPPRTPQPLHDGDELRLGKLVLRVQL